MMSLEECYDALGGNYKAVLGRLSSERIVKKFVLKFLNDQSYVLLEQSMQDKNYEEAFRAAHTIKGVCQNLSFDRLGDSSSRLAEALRSGWTPEADALVDEVKRDYQETADAIRAFQTEIGES